MHGWLRFERFEGFEGFERFESSRGSRGCTFASGETLLDLDAFVLPSLSSFRSALSNLNP